MTDSLNMRELIEFVRDLPRGVNRALMLAQVVTIQDAELNAKRNAQRQFTGRNDRRLSGTLMNSIYSGFEQGSSGGLPIGFIGVRNIPYGAIHEFGGEIKPKRARKLWLPKYANAGKMTPREFMGRRKSDPSQYFLNDKVAGKWVGAEARSRQLIPLFFLVDKVTIPERPYLRPAMEVSLERFPDHFERFLKDEIR